MHAWYRHHEMNVKPCKDIQCSCDSASIDLYYLYDSICIFRVDYNNSPTWIVRPSKGMIPGEGEQWGRYNLPRYLDDVQRSSPCLGCLRPRPRGPCADAAGAVAIRGPRRRSCSRLTVDARSSLKRRQGSVYMHLKGIYWWLIVIYMYI